VAYKIFQSHSFSCALCISILPLPDPAMVRDLDLDDKDSGFNA